MYLIKGEMKQEMNEGSTIKSFKLVSLEENVNGFGDGVTSRLTQSTFYCLSNSYKTRSTITIKTKVSISGSPLDFSRKLETSNLNSSSLLQQRS